MSDWRILTVQPPWSTTIFHGKDIENRSASWTYRGPVMIHSGKRWSERGAVDGRVHRSFPGTFFELEAAPRGVVLGVVNLVDCHPDLGCCRPWGESSYEEHPTGRRRACHHLVLEDPFELFEPLPAVGGLGLRRPPSDLIDAVEDAVAGYWRAA